MAEQTAEKKKGRRRKKSNNRLRRIPCLPLRGLTVFPYMVLHFDVGRQKSIAALEEAMINDQELFLVTQKDAKMDDPGFDDIYHVGTVSKIKQLLKLPGDTIRVLVEGLKRGRIVKCISTDPYFEVEIEEIEENDPEPGDLEQEALMRSVLDIFEDYVKLGNRVSPDTLISVNAVEKPGQLADIIAANVLVKIEDKQNILEAFDPQDRLEKLYGILTREIQILEIERKINQRVKKQIDKLQREYYLREQLKAIQKELGEKDGIGEEVEEYRRKIEEAQLPEEAYEKAMKELDRLYRMPPGSPEIGIIRTYLDWLVELPWNVETEDNTDIKKAAKILDEDHYGLEKVKERVLEYLAVHQLTQQMKGPILCFVGPPGVGKTSIARSIARALNRKFVRMSLGGVRDEAEIRGHRRTYVGAIPGRIIASIRQAGTKNPVFLFDEIDKMSSDFRGDPASAMLEVLDPEQNFAFRDHYLEVPFDLSKVMFLTTANTLETIPRPLLDRMEVIHISGYTEEEKLHIASRYLIPKQVKEHGLKEGSVQIPERVIRDIINYYTREAGVRNLERQIATICRKAARKILETGQQRVRITSSNLKRYLGVPIYRYEKAGQHDQAGIVTGLAWTAVGGDTLLVEAIHMPGTGKLVLTGQLGDVMKESAQAGFSYIRAKARDFGIDPNFYNNTDIHVHIPEGAIPKDGPSAGITMTTAIISALTGIPARSDVAMTGEITLRGRVLPIGGLKEKVLAAHRAGITKVIIPSENEKDLKEIPENVKRKVKIVLVEHMDQVLEHALVEVPKPKQ
ncbi:MAG: endopeptidase La [Caldicoprobacter oshimai]|uniref:Lon protease n=1 Tax=Caldicoprobacter faecalis TaxID=937334 RepID=A0A1I5VH44_9FIRM|nr:endopeptidase La [Caldicoprobacter faecalis]PZN10659.1 MAG: endopeptidase La [Caldicoprobacter oshimai]SFQ06810.1 ATP-dependent proteinase. Serine peptidase. MEROPS family S16 [Caldicoprobacter faecalis]